MIRLYEIHIGLEKWILVIFQKCISLIKCNMYTYNINLKMKVIFARLCLKIL